MRIEDLTTYWQRRFEDAYARANEEAGRRERCSREDFASGYIAALLQLQVPIERDGGQ